MARKMWRHHRLPDSETGFLGFNACGAGTGRSATGFRLTGYQDNLIGATVRQHGGTRVLKWNELIDLFGTNGMVEIASQSTGLPASEDRIISVAGLVENPRENETIVQINKTLLRDQTVLIRVIGSD